MQLNDILLDAFGRVREAVYDAVEGLGEDDLAFRPNDSANSIAWLAWHLTRIQDDHLARAMSAEQVWTRDGWAGKFNLPFDNSGTGYGHNPDEVAAVRTSADLLLAYHDAVHAQTAKYIKQLTAKDYEKVVDKHWIPPVTLSVRLVSVISDTLQHAGQAAYLRGLTEKP
ncbi:MAG TPA: DUF664 domain-containing protein [Candidatus Saccharimonadales bacterium]|jgi:uncharacterized damage-inducible protein DinB